MTVAMSSVTQDGEYRVSNTKVFSVTACRFPFGTQPSCTFSDILTRKFKSCPVHLYLLLNKHYRCSLLSKHLAQAAQLCCRHTVTHCCHHITCKQLQTLQHSGTFHWSVLNISIYWLHFQPNNKSNEKAFWLLWRSVVRFKTAALREEF